MYAKMVNVCVLFYEFAIKRIMAFVTECLSVTIVYFIVTRLPNPDLRTLHSNCAVFISVQKTSTNSILVFKKFHDEYYGKKKD